MKVGFIGAGNMAGAIIRGMAANGFRGEDMLVYDTDGAKLTALFEECGICIAASGAEATAGVDALVLAVKPRCSRRCCRPCPRRWHRAYAAGDPRLPPAKRSTPSRRWLARDCRLSGDAEYQRQGGEAMSAFCGNGADHRSAPPYGAADFRGGRGCYRASGG